MGDRDGGVVYEIAKTFRFEAAHSLPSLPGWHKCRRQHGHSYRVTLILQSSRLDEHGFVRDYSDLSEFRDWLMMTCDHQFLDDRLECPTSAECLARAFYTRAHGWYPELVAVRVSETEDTYAEYRPDAT